MVSKTFGVRSLAPKKEIITAFKGCRQQGTKDGTHLELFYLSGCGIFREILNTL